MSRLDFLRGEHDKVRAAIEHIEANPAGANGDLSDEQDEQVAALYARAAEIGTELQPLVERHRSMEATAKILASVGVAQSASRVVHAPGVKDVSEAEYFASYCRAMLPGDSSYTVLDHVERYRTVATQTTADTAGILPTPIVGPVISLIDSHRYVIPTLTNRPMPASGKTFERPKITQHVDVDEQAAELDELASQKMTVTSDTVTKRTFGGTLEMSVQDRDWTDPAALQLVFDDFGKIYARNTDAVCAASLLATASATVAWTATSVGTKLASFGNAAQAIYTAASVMPTDYWCSLDEAIELATLTDTAGNLIFPQVGNGRLDLSDTQSGIALPLGLKLHVVPTWASNKRVMGVAALGEVYEQRNGFLQVAFPSVLKIQLGYYGYLAQYYTAAGFVSLV